MKQANMAKASLTGCMADEIVHITGSHFLKLCLTG